jgi:hypothetical protein
MPNGIKYGGAAAVFLLLFFGMLPAQATPRAAWAYGSDLQRALDHAVAAHDSTLVIPPGTYRLAPPAGQGEILHLIGARDLTVIADGVHLVGVKRTRMLSFSRCAHVTVRGFSIDYDPLTFTQGLVTEVAADKSWIDVKIDVGYPQMPFARIDICDPKTRFRKHGMPFLWGTTAAFVKPGLLRVTLKGIGAAAALGDPVSLSDGNEAGGICHGMTVENCAVCKFQNITLYSAPGMGIVESDGEGGNTFTGIQIIPGPPPPGATASRLLTTSWDGFLSRNEHVGPRVENCVIESCGDDSWSMQSDDYQVLKCDGRTVILSGSGVAVGDRLQSALQSPAATILSRRDLHLAEANLAPEITQKIAAAEPYTRWRVGDQCQEVTLDRDPPFRVGDRLFDPDRQGHGFVFCHNHVYSSGRGALIKGGYGLIEGNVFRSSDKAIVLSPETFSGGMEQITIRGNTIRDTGYFCDAPWSEQAGAISISGFGEGHVLHPAGLFRDIVIEDNIFEGISGLNLTIASAEDVTVRRNRFLHCEQVAPLHHGESYGIDQHAVIWVGASHGVHFQANVILGIGPFGTHPVELGPDAAQITGLPDGVRVAPKPLSAAF